MKIIGIDGMTAEEVKREIARGAKFVIYHYCVSIIVLTFRRGSEIYFIRPGESAFAKGLPFTAASLVLGWWGFPWGPIYTIGALATNCGGGKDVTREIAGAL